MNNLLNLFRSMGPVRSALLVGGLLLAVGLITAVGMRVNQAPMTLLYGGLDSKEAAGMAASLDAAGVNYEVRGDGALYVPQNQVGQLRLKLAGEGMVGNAVSGYEVLENGSSFGTTALVQNINARRALEGELARTIMSLPAVKLARVHLVMPERKLFSREATHPTASVTLNLGGRRLSEDQVQSIAYMVAASVPELSPAYVTVVDQRGALLSRGQGEEATDSATGARKLQLSLETKMEADITRLLERVVGTGRASVEVNADLNMNRVEEEQEIFNPEQQIARSEQRSEQIIEASEGGAGGEVGATGNIPGQGTDGGAGGSASESETRTDETINYEIGRTVRRMVQEVGAIEKLHVAVLVEGDYEEADGAQVYVPLSNERKQKLTDLVETAIGYDQTRGDTVRVVDMPFEHPDVVEDVPEPPLFSKEDIFRMLETGSIVFLALLVLLLVIRPILKAADPEAMAKAEVRASRVKQDAMQRATADSTEPRGMPMSNAAAAADADTGGGESMINLAKVEGKVKESSVKSVTEIIDKYPDESLGVIRGWIASEGPPPRE